ncbi:MAG: hypothetical protein ABI780_11845 [Ardenticatenales bacterium]
MARSNDPDWDAVLRAAARLQQLVPDAVLVGGAAAAVYAPHRVSLADDHVVEVLRDRFDAVLGDLEATDGWITARVKRPVLILGRLDGVETGIRNLIRRVPLEIEVHQTPHGPIRVPTLAEMTRIKAWLVLVRNATRDYLDVVALADQLGPDAVPVLLAIDRYYVDQQGLGGARVCTQIARQLAEPRPYDLADVDLPHYRRLAPRWRDWTTVADACRALSVAMLDALVDGHPPVGTP